MSQLSDLISHRVLLDEEADACAITRSRQDGARRGDTLEEAARVAAPPLRSALDEARERLADDWRPPQQPLGIVVLRYDPPRGRGGGIAEPAITPAALKKSIATDWIEIEVRYEDGSPFSGKVELEMEDGRKETVVANDGRIRFDGLVPGSVKVALPEVDSGAWGQGA